MNALEHLVLEHALLAGALLVVHAGVTIVEQSRLACLEGHLSPRSQWFASLTFEIPPAHPCLRRICTRVVVRQVPAIIAFILLGLEHNPWPWCRCRHLLFQREQFQRTILLPGAQPPLCACSSGVMVPIAWNLLLWASQA